jgi:hypothetical protein
MNRGENPALSAEASGYWAGEKTRNRILEVRRDRAAGRTHDPGGGTGLPPLPRGIKLSRRPASLRVPRYDQLSCFQSATFALKKPDSV